jgi:hypothetical protein
MTLARFQGLGPYLGRYLGAEERLSIENGLARVLLDAKTLETLPLDGPMVETLKGSDLQEQLTQIVEAYGGALGDSGLESEVNQLTELLERLLGDRGLGGPSVKTTPDAPTRSSKPVPGDARASTPVVEGNLLSVLGDARRLETRLDLTGQDIGRQLEEAVAMAQTSMRLIAKREGASIEPTLARPLGLKAPGQASGRNPRDDDARNDRDRLVQLAAVLATRDAASRRDRLAALDLLSRMQKTVSIQPVAHAVAAYLLTIPYDEYAQGRQSVFRLQNSAYLASALADSIGGVKGVTRDRVQRLMTSLAGIQDDLRGNWLRLGQGAFRRHALSLIESGRAVGPSNITRVDPDSVLDWRDLLADIYYEQAAVLGGAGDDLADETAPSLILDAMIASRLKILLQGGAAHVGRAGDKLGWVSRLHEAGQSDAGGGDSVSMRGAEAGALIQTLDDRNGEAETLIEQVRNGELVIMKLWVLLSGG